MSEQPHNVTNPFQTETDEQRKQKEEKLNDLHNRCDELRARLNSLCPVDMVENRQGAVAPLSDLNKELTLLKIRSLIADKEMVTAQANLDLARGGWTMDYWAWHVRIDRDITQLDAALRGEESTL